MKTIVKTAIEAGSFKTLVEALKAADLVDTLSGDGPFTVFAPTDQAFSKIPKEKLKELLKDKSKLTDILAYHVAPGMCLADMVSKATNLKTVQGTNLKISKGVLRRGLKINNSSIIRADIKCTNGVIHVIDNVLLPS